MLLDRNQSRQRLKGIAENCYTFSRIVGFSIQTIVFLLLAIPLTACSIESQFASPTIDQPIPKATAIPTATQPPSPGTVDGFRYFLLTSTAVKADQRQPMVNQYMAQVSDIPITGDGEVVFLWQGAADSVSIIGEMNGWDRDGALLLTRLEGTDLWFIERNFDNVARLEYRFVINESRQLLDPLNPDTFMSESGPNSVLKMPDYGLPAELRSLVSMFQKAPSRLILLTATTSIKQEPFLSMSRPVS